MDVYGAAIYCSGAIFFVCRLRDQAFSEAGDLVVWQQTYDEEIDRASDVTLELARFRPHGRFQHRNYDLCAPLQCDMACLEQAARAETQLAAQKLLHQVEEFGDFVTKNVMLALAFCTHVDYDTCPWVREVHDPACCETRVGAGTNGKSFHAWGSRAGESLKQFYV